MLNLRNLTKQMYNEAPRMYEQYTALCLVSALPLSGQIAYLLWSGVSFSST